MFWKITENKDWQYLVDTFDWIAGMQHTEQNPFYHGEGNVAEHTRLVLKELEQSDEFQELDEQNREILWASALLHDIGKCITTRMEDDNIVSPYHARRGEYITREMLFKDIFTPFEIREKVAALVRYHGLPVWLFERPDPQKKLFEASLRIDMRLLKLLALIDVKGRICVDKEKLLEQVDFFEMYCKEQDCWDKPRKFPNNHARFRYFNTENAYPDYVPHDDFKCEVLLLSALPGMGKDFYIQKQHKDWPVISLDDIRRKHKLSPLDGSATGWVVQQAKEQARVYLRQGQNFIWNATNITRQMRQQLIDLFITYHAEVKIVYIEKPYKTWLEQNRNREYPIPQQSLEKMLQKLEIPQLWEAHEVIYEIGE